MSGHTMEQRSPDVCIIGSGVAGLSAALSLQRAGFNVKVFERDFDFVDRKQGYGLTLTYSTDGPLSKLGVLEECIANNCPSHCHYIFSTTGDVLGYYGRELKSKETEDRPEQGGNRGNLRIPRQDLRMMLIRKLKPGTIQWGYSLLGYSETAERVSLQFRKNSSTDDNFELDTIQTSVLVGADGIRSIVRQLRDEKHSKFLKSTFGDKTVSSPSGTHYLGVAVIIGLSAISHPHVNNRGFYVVNGESRMFTMPYVAPRIVENADGSLSDEGEHTTGQTMWQLSFSGLDESQATALRRSGPEGILAEALRRTEGWFVPVQDMIRATLPGELWATGLYDRDPMAQFEKGSLHNGTHGKKPNAAEFAQGGAAPAQTGEPVGGTRVTVIGDAAHPMSMFKGQGANQALADGPLLTQWLLHGASKGKGGKKGAKNGHKNQQSHAHCENQLPAKRSFDCVNDATSSSAETKASEDVPDLSFLDNQHTVFTRLRCFEREMCDRTTPKVLASREAAAHLHSPAVMKDIFGIAGVRIADDTQNDLVLAALRDGGANATMGADLDHGVKVSLQEFIQ